jgi:hypothetical protein
LLTVTGSSGTVNWGGQTWNLPGDSGVQKSVCPTFYQLYTTGSSPQEYWQVSGLSLIRGLIFGPGRQYIKWNSYPHANATDAHSFYGFTQYDLGVMTSGMPLPTASDYKIPNGFFGNYTTGGITFAWARGLGW